MDLVWNILATIWAIIGSAWFAMMIHEGSHYFCGRAVGVPRKKIAMRINFRQPHVALHDGDQWLNPDQPDYVPTFMKYQPKVARAWGFIAAGAIGETLITTMVAIALDLMGLTVMALILLAVSTAYMLIYVVVDFFFSFRRRKPHGDFSALWQISLGATGITATVIFAVRISALLVLISFL